MMSPAPAREANYISRIVYFVTAIDGRASQSEAMRLSSSSLREEFHIADLRFKPSWTFSLAWDNRALRSASRDTRAIERGSPFATRDYSEEE
jgi:hypothetical protein